MAKPTNWIVATFRYGVESRPLQINVLWYTASGAPTDGDGQAAANAIAQAIWDQIYTPFGLVMTSETKIVGVKVSLSLGGNVFDGVYDPGSDVVGEVEGDTFPEFVAALIQKRTATGGRVGRGRWYIGCIPEGDADNGRLGDTIYGDLQVLGEAMMAGFTAAGLTCVACLYSPEGDNLYPITNTHVVRELATQRRRKTRPLL